MNYNKNNKSRADEDEDDDENDSGGKQIGRNLFVNVRKNFVWDYHFDEPIGSKSQFRQLLQLMYNANEDDIIRLFIGGPGGNLDTTIEIINAIGCCKAKIIGILTGQAASAHSILALAVPELQVCERGRLMIHNASTGNYGKLQEVASAFEEDIKVCHALFKEFYAGFLNENEMRDLLIGKDYYFDSAEIMKRLKKREDYQKALEKAAKEKKVVVKKQR